MKPAQAQITARRRGSRTRSRQIVSGFVGSTGWNYSADGFTFSVTNDDDTDTFHIRVDAETAKRIITQWSDGLARK